MSVRIPTSGGGGGGGARQKQELLSLGLVSGQRRRSPGCPMNAHTAQGKGGPRSPDLFHPGCRGRPWGLGACSHAAAKWFNPRKPPREASVWSSGSRHGHRGYCASCGSLLAGTPPGKAAGPRIHPQHAGDPSSLLAELLCLRASAGQSCHPTIQKPNTSLVRILSEQREEQCPH